MWNDPIVDEVHQTREKLAAEFDFDIKAIFADLRQRQATLGERLVAPKQGSQPKAETQTEAEAETSKPTTAATSPAA